MSLNVAKLTAGNLSSCKIAFDVGDLLSLFATAYPRVAVAVANKRDAGFNQLVRRFSWFALLDLSVLWSSNLKGLLLSNLVVRNPLYGARLGMGRTQDLSKDMARNLQH